MNAPYSEDILINQKNPSSLFITGMSGASSMFYKSTDGGKTWLTYSVSSDSSCGYAVAIHPLNDNILYVGGSKKNQGAFFKSTNGGSTWKETAAGVFVSTVNTLAVDESSPNRVFAGANSGLFKSEDAGETWTKLSSFNTKDIAMNPASPGEIWTAGQNGVHHSQDFGNTWIELETGFPGKTVLRLSQNSKDDILYAGSSGGSVYRKINSDVPLIFPPLNPAGNAAMNRSLLQIEYLNILAWEKNPRNVGIAKYRIYLVGDSGRTRLVELNAETFEYRHRYKKPAEYTYDIVAVDAAGKEGGAVTLLVPAITSNSSSSSPGQ